MSDEILLHFPDGSMASLLLPEGNVVELLDPVLVKRIEVLHDAEVASVQPEPAPPGFLAEVLAWLRDDGRQPQAQSVESVSPDGNDWNGSTEGGFYSTFAVEITWRDDKGQRRCFDASGSDAESLWKHVTRAWPEPAQAQ